VLLRQENGGEAAAENTAAAAATGDFVAILDADDVYLRKRLDALSTLAQARPDLDILTTDGYLCVSDRIVRRNYDRSWRFEIADQRRAIIERNFIFGLAAVRRERLLQHGGFDEAIRWTTDWDLWLRLILAGARAGCVPEPLALYRLRETSLTAQRRDLLLGKLATRSTIRTCGATSHGCSKGHWLRTGATWPFSTFVELLPPAKRTPAGVRSACYGRLGTGCERVSMSWRWWWLLRSPAASFDVGRGEHGPERAGFGSGDPGQAQLTAVK
jgi:Glycosyl transferase family 2